MPVELAECRDEFLNMLEPFTSTCDENLGHITTVKHRVYLEPLNKDRIQSV